MADRQFGTSWRVLANLPSTGLSGTVTLRDPFGEAAGSAPFQEVGQGRYIATIDPAHTRAEGLWTAVWDYGSGTYEQPFTVNAGTGITLGTARVQAAQRVDVVHTGRVAASTLDTITDHSLIGGANDHLGKWVVPDENCADARHFRVVTGFNGSVLTVSSAYAQPLPVGSRYYLFSEHVQPEAVDRAIISVIQSLANSVAISLRAEGLVPDERGIVTLPKGWTRLSEVWMTLDDGRMVSVAPRDWECLAGRRLRVLGANETVTLSITGSREPLPPVWDCSVLDVNPLLLLAGVASELHRSLAGGQATDFDAHLQRANMEFQTFGALLTRVPRLPRNSVPIRP